MISSRLSSASLLLIHLAGGALVAQALGEAWRMRFLLQMIGERATGVAGNVVAWLVLALLAGVVLLAFIQVAVRIPRIWRGEPEADAALRLRGAFYAAVACVGVTVLILQGGEPAAGSHRLRFPISGSLTAAASYAVFALWSVFLPRLRRQLPSGLRRGIDLACMNVCAAVVLAELVLRGAAVLWPNPLLTTESASPQTRRAAGRLAPGTIRLSFPVNAGGHYDHEFLNRSEREGRVLVSIGDSFSYGVVPHAFHFTTVAERRLAGIEIYNMGYPAIGPSDYLYLLESEALPLEPDLVLVQIFIGNDVSAQRHHLGPPAWYDADRYLLLSTIRRLRILSQAELPEAPQAGQAAISTREELLAHYPYLADPFAEAAAYGERMFLDLEMRKASRLGGADESYFPRFFETLEQILRAAGEVPIAFVLIPDEYQIEDAIWEQLDGASGQKLDRDKPQRRTLAWLQQRGVPVLDLLPVLRGVEPLSDGRRHLYHLRDTHFNARGNQVAGEAIARFARALLDDPPPAPVRDPAIGLAEEPLPADPREIVRGFSQVLVSGRARGLVRDVSALPYSKHDVARALRRLLALAQKPSDQEFLRAALLQLAFFQPDVGDEPVDLDSPRRGGGTWRPLVEAELRAQVRR